MSDTDMSTDSLEDCGVDLQFGDQTLDNLAGSLLACTDELLEGKNCNPNEEGSEVEGEENMKTEDDNEKPGDDDDDKENGRDKDSSDDKDEDDSSSDSSSDSSDDSDDSDSTDSDDSEDSSDDEKKEGKEEISMAGNYDKHDAAGRGRSTDNEEEVVEENEGEEEEQGMEHNDMMENRLDVTHPLDLSQGQASPTSPGFPNKPNNSEKNNKGKPSSSLYEVIPKNAGEPAAIRTGVWTCDKVKTAQQGRQGKNNDKAASVSLGFSESLDEMLLQHGEFPAPSIFPPSLRYRRRSPLDKLRHNKLYRRNPVAGMTTPRSCQQEQQQGSPTSLPSVVSWRTCGGGESLCSSAAESMLEVLKRESLPAADHSLTRWSPGAFCLPPDACHPPYHSHQPAEAYPSSKSSGIPPIAHQPPPKAQQQVPRAYQQPPVAHQHQPTPLWQLPSTHYRQSQRCGSPQQVDVNDGRMTETDGGSSRDKGGWSPRRAVINNVVMNVNTCVFRSHPLFPLLRDLAVVDHYYDKAAFNLAPLLSFLPSNTEEMVELYLQRNPQAALDAREDLQSPAVDGVVLDAVAYTHRSILEKVKWTQRATAEKDWSKEGEGEGSGVEEMSDRYVNVLRSSTPISPIMMDDHSGACVKDPFVAHNSIHNPGKDLRTSLDSLSHLDSQLAPLSPIPDTTLGFTLHSLTASYSSSLYNTDLQSTTLATSISSTTPHTHSHTDGRRRTPNTHHSREAREVLRSWLKDHQHYPYPDDDQKMALVQRTGLTAQQVMQWLSNARRRHLPRLRAGQGMQ